MRSHNLASMVYTSLNCASVYCVALALSMPSIVASSVHWILFIKKYTFGVLPQQQNEHALHCHEVCPNKAPYNCSTPDLGSHTPIYMLSYDWHFSHAVLSYFF